ncbi:hypothetical protein JW824_05160, partial [bacterium]
MNVEVKYADIIICKGKEAITLEEIERIFSKDSDKALYQSIHNDEIFEGSFSYIRLEKGSIIDLL